METRRENIDTRPYSLGERNLVKIGSRRKGIAPFTTEVSGYMPEALKREDFANRFNKRTDRSFSKR